MTQGKISVGVDTPSGEPNNAPKGPYITDETENEQAPDTAGDDSAPTPEDKYPGRTETKITDSSEFGSDTAGDAPRRTDKTVR